MPQPDPSVLRHCPQLFSNNICQALEVLPCIGDTLSAEHVGQFYRNEALIAFISREFGNLGAYARAANASDPRSDYASDLLPKNHVMRTYITFAMEQASAPAKELPHPMKGALYIDGQERLQVPQDRPYLFQYVGDNGQVQNTALVPIGG